MPSRKEEFLVERMFDEVSPTYDLANRLMSLGLDRLWRKRLVREAALSAGASVLDLCTGTGDLLLAFGESVSGTGVDLSEGMLARARAKNRFPNVVFLRASALALPFQPSSFDAAVSAWALRNVADLDRFFQEQFRVLRPGGRVLHLEFSLPESRLIRLLYLPILHFYLPLVGRLVSGRAEAYRYLRDTIRAFHKPAEVLQILSRAGFEDCRRIPLTLGAVQLYLGRRP